MPIKLGCRYHDGHELVAHLAVHRYLVPDLPLRFIGWALENSKKTREVANYRGSKVPLTSMVSAHAKDLINPIDASPGHRSSSQTSKFEGKTGLQIHHNPPMELKFIPSGNLRWRIAHL